MSVLKKELMDQYLQDPQLAKQASFCIQKDRIHSMYPNDLFAKEGQSLNEYIDYLLSFFPGRMIQNGYIKECLKYLCAQEHHDYVKVVDELYPIVGKKNAVNGIKIERSIRHFIKKEYLNISEDIKSEVLSAPRDIVPANFYFLCDLVEYIKSHYFGNQEMAFTPEQKEYFMGNMRPEDDAISIIETAKTRQDIKQFLYDKLGQFSFQTTPTHQMIVDAIACSIASDVRTVKDLYACDNFREKWEFGEDEFEYERFKAKMYNLRFTVDSAYRLGNIDWDVYQQIFGDCEPHIAWKQYILPVADYLKEQELVRGLKRSKSA